MNKSYRREIKLYNYWEKQNQIFKPIQENQVTMYVCGPTVYNYIHIGNARPLIVFDVLRKYFELQGYEVLFASNYTDVDDKIINAAQELQITEKELSERFINAYEADRLGLHGKVPTYLPKVTEYMQDIINFIEKLIEKDYAYEVNGDVYFRVSKVAEYGKLSNTNVDDLLVGARIEQNTDKENPLDFTLWKSTELGISWSSPWSSGRPGWHTECVVMIDKIFNGKIDIHAGGIDLQFPHHENEIAQAQGCYNHNLANYWLHNGMLNLDNIKMSKSLGNVKLAKDLIEQLGANVLRVVMLSTHYRSPINFSQELIDSSKREVEKISRAYHQASLQLQISQFDDSSEDTEVIEAFVESMSEDLNTANGLTNIFAQIKNINALLRSKPIDFDTLSRKFNSLKKCLYVLGIEFDSYQITPEIRDKYLLWEQAKNQKDFQLADEIRNWLSERGIV